MFKSVEEVKEPIECKEQDYMIVSSRKALERRKELNKQIKKEGVKHE